MRAQSIIVYICVEFFESTTYARKFTTVQTSTLHNNNNRGSQISMNDTYYRQVFRCRRLCYCLQLAVYILCSRVSIWQRDTIETTPQSAGLVGCEMFLVSNGDCMAVWAHDLLLHSWLTGGKFAISCCDVWMNDAHTTDFVVVHTNQRQTTTKHNFSWSRHLAVD